MTTLAPDKTLGQHWLYDSSSLEAMCDAAQVSRNDTILEIGPGLGTLTRHLVKRARQVIALEFDERLCQELKRTIPAENLSVLHGDILAFNLTQLPSDYKVVANVPYYITSKIVRLLLESSNPPQIAALLVQKEVAERMAAKPGEMSILGVSVQFYTTTRLGPLVPAALFTPPPQVDSQIITLIRRQPPLFSDVSASDFFRVVKAGFGEKRKQLRNSLSGGLHLSKQATEDLLVEAQIPSAARAEELSLVEWYKLVKTILSR